MQWSNLTTDLTTLLEYPLVNAASQTPSGVTAFDNFLPTLVSNAEQRIYRELDFLFTREVDGTVVLSNTSRNFTVPAAIIVLQSANVITPASTTPANGTRNPLLIVSKEFIDQTWPTELSGQTVPEYLALVSNTAGIVAPTATANHAVRARGSTCRVGLNCGGISVVPVSAPFRHVAVHIVQAVGIGCVSTNRLGLARVGGYGVRSAIIFS